MSKPTADTLERVAELAIAAVRASHDRDEAIREALKTNSVRTIAAAAGLSPSRIHQIGKRR